MLSQLGRRHSRRAGMSHARRRCRSCSPARWSPTLLSSSAAWMAGIRCAGQGCQGCGCRAVVANARLGSSRCLARCVATDEGHGGPSHCHPSQCPKSRGLLHGEPPDMPRRRLRPWWWADSRHRQHPSWQRGTGSAVAAGSTRPWQHMLGAGGCSLARARCRAKLDPVKLAAHHLLHVCMQGSHSRVVQAYTAGCGGGGWMRRRRCM